MTRWTLLAPALAAALLLACSGGKNNNGQPSPSATSAAAAVARTAPPPTASPVGPTPTPVRTLPPSAARANPTATPGPRATAAPGASPLPLGAGATRDQALQQQLEGALLKPSDLPSGFSQAGDVDRDLNDPAEVASVARTFTRLQQSGSSAQVQAVYAGLMGFKDAATAHDQLQSLPQSLSQSAGSDFQIQPASGVPSLGDETQSFRVSGQTGGLIVAGYAVIWRRGRLAAVLIFVGTPAVQSIDDAASPARTQDQALQSIR